MVATKEDIKAQFPALTVQNSSISSSYNIAPTQLGLVVTNEHPTTLQTFVWGLVPHWSKDGKNTGRLINARAEGIATKPSFRIPIRRRRCLVLADSFYEWKKVGKQKFPYRILLKSKKILVFGGIWEEWQQGEQNIKSFSIITTPPNKEMSFIHNRMPLILPTEERQTEWLKANDNINQILSMLDVLEDNHLILYPVSTQVNKVGNDGSKLHERLNPNLTLF